jgi:hypothetical protein
MSFQARKRAELAHKLGSIEAEFDRWREVSAPAQPLEKHHTQVLRITKTLRAFADGVEADLGEDGDAAAFARMPELEVEILEVHRLWDYFRVKLAQRNVEWLKSHLAAADDLASACYAAAQATLAEDRAEELKEPPLVCFTGSSSPVASARGELFEGEVVPGEPLVRGGSPLVRRLPIPVIEVPWYQLGHLPDAPAICHEVGHTVEDDLRLGDRLRVLLEAALEGRSGGKDRQPVWTRWLGEVFADIYGCLGTGPAFVSMLMDVLAPDVLAGVEFEPDDSYPPVGVRIALNLHALVRLGHDAAAEDLRTRWSDDTQGRGDADDEDAFAGDVPRVVDRLLWGPYPELGCVALVDVLRFTETDHRQSVDAARRLLGGGAPATKNVRHLHAAARLAFDFSPARYDANGVGSSVLMRLDKDRKSGPRGRVARALDVNALDDHDVALGAELRRLARHHRA